MSDAGMLPIGPDNAPTCQKLRTIFLEIKMTGYNLEQNKLARFVDKQVPI
jgi:hypothetical protein